MKRGYFYCVCGIGLLVFGIVLMVMLVKTADFSPRVFLKMVSFIIITFVGGFALVRMGSERILKATYAKKFN